MKTVRLIIIVIIVSLVLSVWTPVTASAKAEDDQVILVTGLSGAFEGTHVVNLTVDNRTGGSLFMTFVILPFRKDPTRTRSYLLLAPKQGKNQYQIFPGIYTYTIRSSNCGGKRLNTKLFKGDVTLGPYFCDKK